MTETLMLLEAYHRQEEELIYTTMLTWMKLLSYNCMSSHTSFDEGIIDMYCNPYSVDMPFSCQPQRARILIYSFTATNSTGWRCVIFWLVLVLTASLSRYSCTAFVFTGMSFILNVCFFIWFQNEQFLFS